MSKTEKLGCSYTTILNMDLMKHFNINTELKVGDSGEGKKLQGR